MEYVVQTQIIEDQVVAKPLSMKVRRPSKNESSTTKHVLFTGKKLGLQMFGHIGKYVFVLCSVANKNIYNNISRS